ncbi:phytochrome-like protein cph1 [mine drainage metagenome]|uniref:histidine kinase n=1 Tax=mine drainage metagenome TaxID=410659 RepID=A0A1J5RKZ9_9ZZZZ
MLGGMEGMFRPTIGRKFAALFAALILLGLANQLIVRAALNQFSRRVAIVDASSSLRQLSLNAQVELLEFAGGVKTSTAGIDQQLGRFDATLNALETGVKVAGQKLPKLPDELQPEWESLRHQWRAYRDNVQLIEDRLKAGRNIRAQMLALDAEDQRLVSATQTFVADLTEHYRKFDRATIVWLYWLGMVDLILILASFLAIRAHIVHPLRRLSAASRAISAGNYGARSGYRSRDEIGQLAAAFDDMAEATERHVEQIENDIVTIRRTKSELRQSYREIEDLYNNAPCGYHSVDPNGVLVRINDTELAWLGYRREEVVGKLSFSDLLSSQNRDLFSEHFPLYLERGYVRDLEVELVRKDGTVLPILLSATALEDEAGRFVMSRASSYDMSRIRQTESVLKEQQALLRHFMESSPLSMLIVDTELRYLSVNEAFAEISGMPVEAHLGRTIRQVLPQLAPALESLYQRVLATGEPLRNIEVCGEVPFSGVHRCWLVSYFPILGSRGGVTAVGGVVLDITERKDAEECLRKSEAALAQAQRIARMGSWELDIGSGRQHWSDETYRIFGFEPGSVEPDNRIFFDLVVPEDRDAVAARRIAAIEGGPSYSTGYRVRLGNGEIRHIDTRAELFRTPDGAALRLVGTVADVTERVNTHRQLALMTQLYAILSQANQAIAHIRDIDALFTEICRIAVHDGTFVMAWAGRVEGERLVPFAHWGRDEGYLDQMNIVVTDPVLGSGPSGVAMREQRAVIYNDIATDPMMEHWREWALERGYRSSAVFPLAQGREIFGAFTLYAESPQVFSAEVLSLLQGLSWDLSFALDAFLESEMRRVAETGLKRLNEQLEWRVAERTRELEVANRELESFSYSVSHDLRAPLRSIDGFSQIVLKRYGGQLDEAGRGYLDRVRRASQRMGGLIDDLLQLARISSGELRRQDVDLSRIAGTVIEELRHNDPERRILCQVRQGLCAYGDPGLMRVVLDNLIGNAWKFTRHSSDPQIEIGEIEQAGEVVYFVRDNGAGFDGAYSNKLFQAFQRLHRESEFEGMGIGLATVQRVIQRHKGRVWAEGEPDRGATFYFTLPQRQEQRA